MQTINLCRVKTVVCINKVFVTSSIIYYRPYVRLMASHTASHNTCTNAKLVVGTQVPCTKQRNFTSLLRNTSFYQTTAGRWFELYEIFLSFNPMTMECNVLVFLCSCLPMLPFCLHVCVRFHFPFPFQRCWRPVDLFYMYFIFVLSYFNFIGMLNDYKFCLVFKLSE